MPTFKVPHQLFSALEGDLMLVWTSLSWDKLPGTTKWPSKLSNASMKMRCQFRGANTLFSWTCTVIQLVMNKTTTNKTTKDFDFFFFFKIAISQSRRKSLQINSLQIHKLGWECSMTQHGTQQPPENITSLRVCTACKRSPWSVPTSIISISQSSLSYWCGRKTQPIK